MYEATYHRALLDQDAGFCSCRPHLPNSTPQHQQARLRGRDEESEVGKSRRQLHLRSVQRIATHKITEQLRTSSYRLYAPTSRAEAAAPGGRTPATASYRLYLKAGGAAQCSDLDRGLRASKRARASKDVQHPRWRWLAAARARGKGAMTGGSLASCGRLARQRRCRQAAPANIQYYQVVLNSLCGFQIYISDSNSWTGLRTCFLFDEGITAGLIQKRVSVKQSSVRYC